MTQKESEWVKSIEKMILEAVKPLGDAKNQVKVATHRKLPYAYEVLQYHDGKPSLSKHTSYETDILISDEMNEGVWTPRVIIECKLGKVTTHDALTYSAKAATHKNVHPYIRYGILIGNLGKANLPPKLVRHGAHFDFMAVWIGEKPTDEELLDLKKVLQDEINASRNLQSLLFDRSAVRSIYRRLHRHLELV